MQARSYALVVMSKNDPQQAQADGSVKPAGRTGEGSGSIVAELAKNQDRRVDQLVNRLGPPDLDANPDVQAR